RDRSRGHGIYRDVAAAQFVVEHVDESLNACLGSDVRTIGWKRFGQHTARKSNDAATFNYMLRCLSEHEEGTAQIGGNHLVKHLHVAICDSPERHDACAVHYHIDPAESVERFLKQSFHVGGDRYIGPHSDNFTSGRLDLLDNSCSFSGVARIVHDDGEAVARQPYRDGSPNAPPMLL